MNDEEKTFSVRRKYVSNGARTNPQGLNGRLPWFTAMGVAAVFLLALGWIWWTSPSMPLAGGFQPSEAAAKQFASQDVLGDLGGMPVKIPKHFANYVEYDDDPGWGDKRTSPRPPRTLTSKLRSFGFEVRFPDMRGLEGPDMYEHKRKSAVSRTDWMDVGVTTGSFYPGDGFLERRMESIIKSHGIFKLEPVGSLEHGLQLYAAPGIDPVTKRPNREHDSAQDVYVHTDQEGHVDAYIQCSNRPHSAAPCAHTFRLSSGISAKVYVSYRRGMLPHWMEIQKSVSQMVMSFGVNRP